MVHLLQLKSRMNIPNSEHWQDFETALDYVDDLEQVLLESGLKNRVEFSTVFSESD